MVDAHVVHSGFSSLSYRPRTMAQGRRIGPGANDDALGLVGVIELARAFASGPKPERTLVFAAWTAEECGSRTRVAGRNGARHPNSTAFAGHQRMLATRRSLPRETGEGQGGGA